MTFEERCERFRRKTDEEINHFKRVYRTSFLNQKIEEKKKEDFEFEKIRVQVKRPKEHSNTKKILK